MLDPMGEGRKYGLRPSGASSETARCDSVNSVETDDKQKKKKTYTSWAGRLIYERKTHILSKSNCPMRPARLIAVQIYKDKILVHPRKKEDSQDKHIT